jgi:hypothetical protein
MLRTRALALFTLPLAIACGDSGTDPTTSSTGGPTSLVTTDPGTTATTGPDDPTGGTAGPTTTPGTSTVTGDPTGDPTGDTSTGTTSPVSASETDPDTTTTTEGTSDDTGSTSTGEAPCPEDTILCSGTTAQVCDGLGGFKSEEVCPAVCVEGVGCLACVPGEASCEGDQVLVCNDEGSGSDVVETCDGLQGLACDPDMGACAGPCAGLGLSYIGCDYYPTVLQQHDGYNTAPTTVYAVAVANTSDQPATVTITRGANMVTSTMVAAGSVQVVTLPWVDALTKGQGPSVVVADGAYRLRSTRPVTVYQYNPLAATTTNDASLLLPVNTWTGNYMVASWPVWQGYPGFYAVVAREDATSVTLVPSNTGKNIKAGGGVAANGTGVVVLNEGDVLQVMASGGDPTGTIVQADKPVQVFGGHECTNVPLGVTACDHLEESMFPIETLSKEYVVVPPVQVPNDNLDKAQVVRVIASEDATTLTFTPDQPVAKVLAKAGDFVELTTTTQKFIVTSDKKILVSQYMVGQSGGYGTSDPAMLLAVNPMQWRKSYLFHAATSWQANYVDVLAPKNANVQVDGNAVGGWQAIGASNYQVAHVKLSNAGNGNHSVTSDVGVGVGVYGVQSFGSYWYPGGLDLDLIPQ